MGAVGSITLRLGLSDMQSVKADLASLGPVGQNMANQIDTALKKPTASMLAFDAGVKEVRGSVEAAAGSTGPLGAGLLTLGMGGLAAGAGLAAAVGAIHSATDAAKEAGDWAEGLRKASDEIGVTTDELQKWRIVGEQFKLSNDQVDQSLQTLQQRIGAIQSGVRDKRITPLLEEMGLTRDDFAQVHNVTAAFDLLASHLDKLDSEAKKVQLLQAFGVPDWLPALERGKAGLDDMGVAAQNSGRILGSDFVNNVADANEKLREADARLETAKVKLGGEFTPALAESKSEMADFVTELDKLLGRLLSLPGLTSIASKGLMALMAIGTGGALGGPPVGLPGGTPDRWPDVSGPKFQSPDRSFTVTKPVSIDPDSTDKAAASKAAAEAKRAIEQEAELRKKITADLDTAATEELSAQKALTGNIVEQGQIEQKLLDAQLQKRLDALQQTVTGKDGKPIVLTDKQQSDYEAAVNATIDAFIAQKNAAQNSTADKLAAEQLGYQKDIDGYYEQIASITASMATTLAERRQLELDSLKRRQALEDQELANERQAALEKATDQKQRDTVNSQFDLKSTLQTQVHGAQTQQANFNLQDPGQKYLFDLNSGFDMSGQKVEVTALQDLNGELDAMASGSESAGSAFENLGKKITATLADIAIQETIIRPLAGLLFGGGAGLGYGGTGSGILGGLMGQLFGMGIGPLSQSAISLSSMGVGPLTGAGLADVSSALPMVGYAAGTPDAAPGWHVVGEHGQELVNFGDGGAQVYNHYDTISMLNAANDRDVAPSPMVLAPPAHTSPGRVTVNNYGKDQLQPQVSHKSNGDTVIDLYTLGMQPGIRSAGADGTLYQAMKASPPPVRKRG